MTVADDDDCTLGNGSIKFNGTSRTTAADDRDRSATGETDRLYRWQKGTLVLDFSQSWRVCCFHTLSHLGVFWFFSVCQILFILYIYCQSKHSTKFREALYSPFKSSKLLSPILRNRWFLKKVCFIFTIFKKYAIERGKVMSWMEFLLVTREI